MEEVFSDQNILEVSVDRVEQVEFRNLSHLIDSQYDQNNQKAFE